MTASEFPRLKKYETPEIKEEMERILPNALGRSLNLFLDHHLFLLNTPQLREGLPGRVQQITKLNRRYAHHRILEQIKSQHYLEALAILDISVRNLEFDIIALDYIPVGEQDTEWKEEKNKTAEKRDNLAYHRDRLIEEEPRLHKEYTKKDFENWARDTMSGQQSSLKEEIDEEDRGDLLERMAVLDKVLTATLLSKEDVSTLLFEINDEIALCRDGMEKVTVNYLLGEKFQEGRLLDYLGKIIKFRQFQAGVESREWIRVA